MSGTTTPNLGLFNTNMLTDGDDFFDFDRDLNGNNNILDAAIGKLSTLTTEQKTSLVAAINELVAEKSSIDLDNLSSIGQAIMDKKVEVEALLQQNGYAKFSWKENNQISNLIINWGQTKITNNSGVVTSFAHSFSNDAYSLTATHHNGESANSVVALSMGYKNPTYCYISNNIGENPAFMYIAIGE